jgi:hypothetical protein
MIYKRLIKFEGKKEFKLTVMEKNKKFVKLLIDLKNNIIF